MNSKLAKALAKYARLDDGVGEVPAVKPPKMPASSMPLPNSPSSAGASASSMPGAPGSLRSSATTPSSMVGAPSPIPQPPTVGASQAAQPGSPPTPAFGTPAAQRNTTQTDISKLRELSSYGNTDAQAPKPPGMDPRLKALSADIEEQYNTLLTPEMRAQDAKDGFIRGQLTQEQINARNNYKLYKGMASGNMEVNDRNLGLLGGPRSDASIWTESIARTVAPEAVAVYDTAKGVMEGKGLGESASAAFSQALKDRAEYADMFNDQLKRVANRYGANYELNYGNDKLLDWGSYALEAAPSLFLTAATMGGSTALQGGALAARGTALASKIPGAMRAAQIVNRGAQAVGRGAQVLNRVPGASQAGQFIAKGFQPFAQTSTNAGMRYLGSVAPRVLNSATSAINPVQAFNALRGLGATSNAITAGNVLRSGLVSGFAPLIFQNSANAYANAARDVNHYNQVNPDAGVLDNLGRFGQSMASNVSFDPAVLIPGRAGAFISNSGVTPSILLNPIGDKFNQNFQDRLDQSYAALEQKNPERYQSIMMDPELRAQYEDSVRLSMTDPRQYIIDQLQKKDPAQYAKLQADPEAMDKYVSDVQKNDRALQGGGLMDTVGSFMASASPYFKPSARSLGAVGFREQDAIDQQAMLDASDNYLTALAIGEDPMQDPKVQRAMQGASGLAKERLASNIAQMVGDQAIPAVTGMHPEELTYALETQDPSQLMNTPLGAFAQGDPQMAMEAADTMYGFQQAMPLLQQEMAQSGQISPEFVALIRAMNAMQSSYQVPPTYGSQELHPGMQAIKAMQPVLQSLFEKQQQGLS